MKLTAITATYNRPEAIAICRRYVERQTRPPDQWLVLDGPEPMPEKILAAIEGGRIEGEAVAFFEDDDWFRPDWLEWVEGAIKGGYEIVGEGNAVYYQVRNRWFSECKNVRHAALVQTAVHRDLLESVADVIRSYRSPFFDTRLWQLAANKFLALPKSPAERRVVGIKGMYGSAGYSGEHNSFLPEGVSADPSALQLWRWIGADASNYLRFYDRATLPPPRV